MFKEIISYLIKGILIGVANVIPGVSGGTIALITGILERLLNVIKNVVSFKAFKLLFKGEIKDLIQFIDFNFAFSVTMGVFIAIISVAKLFKILFAEYPVYIWSFFFGLILASVYFVTKQIKHVNIWNIAFFIIGTSIAVLIAVLKPASENKDLFYIFICGIVASSAMILPGVSGSFVLVLMGNYELIMIKAINDFDFSVLIPAAIGAILGLIILSHILSWLFKNYPDQIIALLSGFMLGSLLTIWPWKNVIWKTNSLGEYILNREGERIVEKYSWFIPNKINQEVIIAILMILLGIIIVWLLEFYAKKTHNNSYEKSF
jgi:putative membrane protein